jgi:DNA-binding GntR family transcriptional regulator
MDDLHRGRPPADRSQAIQRGLVSAILEQQLLPGTKLGEDELGQIYGASRTIVRAALQALAHEGIIDIEKNRGAFVAKPSPGDAHEVFAARILIEPQIARIAANASTGPLPFAAHLAAERAAVAQGDDRAAIRLSGEFHLLIAAHAGHRVYANFLRELVARSSLIILLYRNRGATICGTAHHELIAQRIAERNGHEAAQLMIEHLHEIESGLDLVDTAANTRSLSDILVG